MNTPTQPSNAPSQRRLVLALGCVPFVAWLAWLIVATRFLCDDAFITFRYARHLAEGDGLVFNPGERVEGFVNLLWTLELAGLWRLGLRPELAAPALSIALTAGTLLMVAMMARQLAMPAGRAAVLWITLGLLACSPQFAMWSTGGLETRQFTFCVTAGVFFLWRQPRSYGRVLAASLAFGAAELTRPEGLLLGAVAGGWIWLQHRAVGEGARGRLLAFGLPFAAIVVTHYVWRHAYFGEWLPNPYHAKHVQAWYEAGCGYLAAAAIELGAWLWVPLALVALARRAAERDLALLLPFALVGAHALYLLRIGGDHFEFRPLDFYLPLLAAPAAVGLTLLAGWGARLLRPGAADGNARGSWLLAFGGGALAIVYSQAIGTASLVVAMQRQERHDVLGGRTRLDARSAPALRFLPGLLPLCDVLSPLRETLHRHLVAVPAQVHGLLGRELVAGFAAYERAPRGLFPPDAVAAANTVGVMPFYLRDLTVIDVHGLTDATIARAPLTVDNRTRRMAHDRHPPPGYLQQRGVNVAVGAAAPSEAAALAAKDFAVRIDDDLWLPLDAVDREWAQRSFAKDRLAARHLVDSRTAAANRVRLDGAILEGVQLLATFEATAAEAPWTLTGDASISGPTHDLLWGAVGTGRLSTQGPADAVAGRGTARSPSFVPPAGTSLVLFLAGERALGLAVTLHRGDEVLRSFSPGAREHLQPIACPLDEWAGQQLHLEVRDDGPGWLVLDHCLLARPVDDPHADRSRAWSQREPPHAAWVRIEPLRAERGVAVSGGTTITVHNPLPSPVQLSIELVEGPAGASLLCGPWTDRASGLAVARAAPGATVAMQAWLQLAAPVPLAAQPFGVRICAQPDVPDAPLLAAPVVMELPLPWQLP